MCYSKCRYPVFISLAALLVLLFSCNGLPQFGEKIPAVLNQQLGNAAQMLGPHPDSVVLITTRLLKNGSKLNDASLVKLFQLRQEAFFKMGNMDSAIVSAENIRLYAKGATHTQAMANSLIILHSKDIDFKYLKAAEPYFPSAIAVFEKQGKPTEKGIVCLMYGNVLRSHGDYKNSEMNLLIAYKIFDSLGLQAEKCNVCLSMGNVFGDIGSGNEELAWYRQAGLIADQLADNQKKAVALLNIGIHYRKINPDSAVYYYKQALAIIPLNTKGNIKIKTQYNLANVYYDRKDYEIAKMAYMQMLRTCEIENKTEGIAIAYNGLAAVFAGEKRTDLAIEHYKKAIQIADSLKLNYINLKVMTELFSFYKTTGKLPEAILLDEKIKSLNDSLLSEDKQLAVHELATKYQSEKKELENNSLKNILFYKNIAIFIALLAVVILLIVIRQRNVFYRERTLSYEILMERYKADREVRKLGLSTSIFTLVPEKLQDLIPSQEALSLLEKLLDYFEKEKPYLNPKLKADDVITRLNCTQKELAAVIKEATNLNFTSFTNKYRIEESKVIFENHDNVNLKMSAVAEQAGFGTIQSFYNAFELHTGVKPAYFRSQILF